MATLAAVILTVIALVFFFLGSRAGGSVAATKSWATASATIIQATVEARSGVTADGDTSTTYYPIVVYEYQVNGTQYRNDKRVVGDEVSKGLRSWAERDIAKYQRGMTVPVYYNPANPSEAVLERTSPNATFFNLIAGLMLVIALFFCAFNFGLGAMLDGMAQ